MKFQLYTNARGKLLLTYTEPFPANALWLRYLQDRRVVEILFDNGTSADIPLTVDEVTHSYLLKEDRVRFVLLEEERVPIESYEIHLLVK